MKLNLQRIHRDTLRVTRHGSSVTRHEIKNIIFDFGGVICNIDPDLTLKAFGKLGIGHFDTGDSIKNTKGLFEEFETGVITPQQFRDRIRPFFERAVTDDEIDTAWNALLLDIPEPRIRILESLRKQYRIFLLSNSNLIHYECYLSRFRERYGYAGFDDLFEKAWFSFNLGMKKPSPDIFRYVAEKSRIIPAETLFIDDTLVHVEGARTAGFHAYHLDLSRGDDITLLFH